MSPRPGPAEWPGRAVNEGEGQVTHPETIMEVELMFLYKGVLVSFHYWREGMYS